MADSEASNSSIIISNSSEETIVAHGDTDDANTSYSPLVFDIIKRDVTMEGRGSLITKELFPVKPCLEERRSQHWLALSHDAKASEGRETDIRGFYQKQHQVKKSRRGPRSRSSQYRGVTFYRRTGRWESHIWDCGKQVYLGGFDTAHAAARAYDRAAIRFRGIDADINFSLTDYEDDMKQMRGLSKEEFVHILRRQSTGFARGNSKVKGASLRKSTGWEGLRSAAIEYNSQNLDLSLGISLPQYEAVTGSSSVQTLHGLPLTRQSVPTWPGPVPNSQERGRMELPWWPLGTQSAMASSHVPPAASSRFSRFISSSAAADADPRCRLPHFYSASSSFNRN